MDHWGDDHHTPLCIAASQAGLPLVRFVLQQYQQRGQVELERALEFPCQVDGLKFSLLGHVVKGCDGPEVMAPVAVARYLVQECGANAWTPVEIQGSILTDQGGNTALLDFLPLHAAAMQGYRALVAFFIEGVRRVC